MKKKETKRRIPILEHNTILFKYNISMSNIHTHIHTHTYTRIVYRVLRDTYFTKLSAKKETGYM